MKTQVWFLLALFVTLSCNQSENKDKKYIASSTLDHKETDGKLFINVDSFSTFPKEVNVSACYFSRDDNSFERSVYIYVDDFEGAAFMSINGNQVKFKSLGVVQPSATHLIKKYTAKDFDILIDVEQVSPLNDIWLYKGKLELKSKNGNGVIINIYGECGC